ncbi:MAG TPA: SusC/RagA family TonB-linked outer membrane protein [Gemmatimonadales bacterium]|nr:SusC/RagA family TonB-linked outer membrane protein [Gemmatimonadales bacterium]
MRKRRLEVGSVIALVLAPAMLFAQETGTIRGRVTDAATGQPVADARVTVEGTGLAAASRANGEYVLAAAPVGPRTLTARRVGYGVIRREIDVPPGDAVTADFALRAVAVALDAVVVTGVGTPTEKRTVGNTIEVISGDAISASPGATSIDRALQGKVTGALISQNNGQPGAGVSVRLRGTNSVLGTGEPLWVVDGVIVDNSSDALIGISANPSGARREAGGAALANRLSDIAPTDIERAEVLKGAAAAALYGSRANNGVIQIFTRRGRAGSTRGTVNVELGVTSTPARYELNTASRAGYADAVYAGADTLAPSVTRYNIQDSVFRTGFSARTNLSLSGGAGGTSYYLSGSRTDESGIVRPTGYHRTSLRGRFTQQVGETLELTASGTFIQSARDQIPEGEQTQGALTSIVFTPTAWKPFFNDTLGRYPYNPVIQGNPLAVINTFQAPEDVTRFIGGLEGVFRPRPSLTLRYGYGIDDYRQEDKYLQPPFSINATFTGSIQNPIRLSRQQNHDLTATYVATPAPILSSSTTLGFRYTDAHVDDISAAATGLPPEQQTVVGAVPTASQGLSEFRTLGGFVEERVGFKDRLYVNGGLNLEASSAFGASQRWQLFPRMSASYVLGETEFFRSSGLGQRISTLRLRAAYGETGGQPPSIYGRFSNYVGVGYSGKPGLVASSLKGNPDLKPERQREIEGGLDLGLFADRALLEFTYYHKRTFDLVLAAPLPLSTGFLSQLQNVGVLRNKGWELALNTVNVNKPSVGWRSTLSLAANRSRVEKLVTPNDTLVFGYLNAVIPGQPLGVFYGGIYVRDASGNVVYRDTTIGGILYQQMPLRARDTLPNGTTAFANRIIGDPNPDLIASLLNTFDLGRHVHISVLLDGRFGNDVANFTRRITEFFGADKVIEREISRDTFPRTFTLNPTGRINIYEEYIENGSFVKLREVAVKLRFDQPWVRKLGAETLDLMLAGRNLITWTSYRGLDPEINLFTANTVARGVDFANTPIPRTFTLSVGFNF